jgi:hypothetical protein
VFAPEEGEVADSPAARPNQFGSVWDSQIGMDTRPARLTPISGDEDDYAEPEIPEYLLAERRRGGGRGGRGQGGGGRGVRSAYASAVERERYGRSATPRYSEPVRQPQQRRRDERPARGPQPQQRRGGGMPGGGRDSAEPWSEVPPEIEEILRAQLSTKLAKPAGGDAPSAAEAPAGEAGAAEAPAGEAKVRPATRGRRKPADAGDGESPAEKARPATRGRRKPAEASGEVGEGAEGAETAAPKKRAPARRKTAAAAEAIAGGGEVGGGAADGGEGGEPAGW